MLLTKKDTKLSKMKTVTFVLWRLLLINTFYFFTRDLFFQKVMEKPPLNPHLRSIMILGKGRNWIPMAACAFTHSAPKKILPLGRQSRGGWWTQLEGEGVSKSTKTRQPISYWKLCDYAWYEWNVHAFQLKDLAL